MLKFYLRSKAWGDKSKEMMYSSLELDVISFLLFPQASDPSLNFNIGIGLLNSLLPWDDR